MLISVLIPMYNASKFIEPLLSRLYSQDLGENELEIIVVDSSSSDNTVQLINNKYPDVKVEIIPNVEFDHGGTRNYMASKATGDFLLFMTQDAIPYDNFLIKNMIATFNNQEVAVCYARQIAKEDAKELEVFARSFNYPEKSMVKSNSSIDQLGIKTFFNSNVCSMYRAKTFYSLGKFPEKIILNEDMIFASKAIYSGMIVYYSAEAKVYHSHNYSIKQQFKRYFDIGMAFKDTAHLFEKVSNEKEGFKMIKRQITYLKSQKKTYLIGYAMLENIAKLVGYQFGKKSNIFPYRIKKELSAYLK